MGRRILLVDDHELVREALRRALEDAGYRVLEAADGETGLQRALTTRPHVVLLDVSLPGVDGIATARAMRTRVPETQVVILTMHDELELVRQARDVGAVGYLLKSASSREVVAAVETVLDGGLAFQVPGASGPDVAPAAAGSAAGDQPLTDRERQILQLLADGRRPDEVADALVISPKTVRNHLTNAYDKLGVSSRSAAIVAALQRGLIDLAEPPTSR